MPLTGRNERRQVASKAKASSRPPASVSSMLAPASSSFRHVHRALAEVDGVNASTYYPPAQPVQPYPTCSNSQLLQLSWLELETCNHCTIALSIYTLHIHPHTTQTETTQSSYRASYKPTVQYRRKRFNHRHIQQVRYNARL